MEKGGGSFFEKNAFGGGSNGPFLLRIKFSFLKIIFLSDFVLRITNTVWRRLRRAKKGVKIEGKKVTF